MATKRYFTFGRANPRCEAICVEIETLSFTAALTQIEIRESNQLFWVTRSVVQELLSRVSSTRVRMIRTEPHDTSASGVDDFAAPLSLQTKAKNESAPLGRSMGGNISRGLRQGERETDSTPSRLRLPQTPRPLEYTNKYVALVLYLSLHTLYLRESVRHTLAHYNRSTVAAFDIYDEILRCTSGMRRVQER